MSEEKLALTNEQLGRLLAAVQMMRTQNGEPELTFDFHGMTKEELEMFYGYVWGTEPETVGGRRDKLRQFMTKIAHMFYLSDLSKEETFGILYAVKREMDYRFKD